MDDLLSEKEQIEQMRAWWSEFGGYVIGGLGLGVALLFGFNYYKDSKLEAQLGASARYETLTDHVVTGRVEEAEAVVDDLSTNFSRTTYAGQARLALARLYMDQNRDQDAADELRALLDSDTDVALQHIARTRLARILQYQGESQAVVDLLEGQESEAFAAAWNELLGDAYAELGRIEDATSAYQAALLDPLAPATLNQQLVQWKVLDLPEIEEEPAADDVVEPSEEEGTE